MRIDSPVLLYGAGREAHSTRAFLAERYPDVAVDVTLDSGTASIEGATFVPMAAVEPARYGLIVKSPGVSRYKPFFDAARTAGVPVTSNLNLWAAHYRTGRTVIAITGTKGKSTTATLVHLMLTHSGRDTLLAGNVGVPPLEAANRAEIVVFELSSYQTADMDFAPDIAALTNLYPEHVDWHGTVERYYADKLNIFAHDGVGAVALGEQARSLSRVTEALPAQAERLPALPDTLDAAMVRAAEGSRLKGAHNLDNARLAARIARAAGASEDGIVAAIGAFAPLPHRLEELAIGHTLFVDDSIATTPEATKVALAAYRGKRIALIAGGHERAQDYDELATMLDPAGVVELVCLPDTGARLAAAARFAAPQLKVREDPTLADAMRYLAETGENIEVVLLSPGAPSYNQFKNFEERGETFKRLARTLFASEAP